MSSYMGYRGLKARTQTISITSGKGGVGKTSLVANLAMSMAARGKRVLILDGDLGMANVDLMFGIRPQGTIEQVVHGVKSLEEVIIQVRPNIYLIPGGSGVYGLSRLDVYQKQVLLNQVNGLDHEFDLMLIDTAPGIDENVLYLNAAAEEILVLLTADPASLTDAYALIKVLNQRYNQRRFTVAANMVKDDVEGLQVFKRLADVADRFLAVSLDWAGSIPVDQNLRQATKSQQLVVQSAPHSDSALAIRSISEKLCGFRGLREPKGGLQFFWQQLSGVA